MYRLFDVVIMKFGIVLCYCTLLGRHKGSEQRNKNLFFGRQYLSIRVVVRKYCNNLHYSHYVCFRSFLQGMNYGIKIGNKISSGKLYL
jgi:hypothetical protein